jgi:serine/threonine protein kinase
LQQNAKTGRYFIHELLRQYGEEELNRPNFVKMLDAVQEDSQHYIIMELVAGGSLRDALKKETKMPVQGVLEIALDVADALTRAHRLDIIHRDIKPTNVLPAASGTPRLTDFGIARVCESEMTDSGVALGTSAYFSPETQHRRCIRNVLSLSNERYNNGFNIIFR